MMLRVFLCRKTERTRAGNRRSGYLRGNCIRDDVGADEDTHADNAGAGYADTGGTDARLVQSCLFHQGRRL